MYLIGLKDTTCHFFLSQFAKEPSAIYSSLTARCFDVVYLMR
jgi:hypothetical protein